MTTATAQPPPVTPLDKFPIRDVLLADINPPEPHRHALSRTDAEIEQLAASIAQVGQQTPILLNTNDRGMSVVYGAGRYAAATKLGLKTIRAICAEDLSDYEILAHRGTENLARLENNPVDEAMIITELLARAPYTETSRAIAHVAASLGKSEKWVRDRSYLVRLSPKVQELIVKGLLTLGHARELAKLFSHEKQEQLASYAQSGDGIGWTVETLRHQVANAMHNLSSAIWPLNISFAGAPPCDACPKNAANEPELFEGQPDAGLKCTDSKCFDKKHNAARQAMEKATDKIKSDVASGQLKPTAAALSKAGKVPNLVTPTAMAAAVKRTVIPNIQPDAPAASKPELKKAEFIRDFLGEHLRKHDEAEGKKLQAAKAHIWAVIRSLQKKNPLIIANLALLMNSRFFVDLLETSREGVTKNTKQVRNWIRLVITGQISEVAQKICDEGKTNDKGMGDVYALFREDNPWEHNLPSDAWTDEWWIAVAPEFGYTSDFDMRSIEHVEKDLKEAAERAWENKQAKDGKPAKKGGKPSGAVGMLSSGPTGGKKSKHTKRDDEDGDE